MNTSQTDFRHALLDAGQPVPNGIVAPDGGPAEKRFAVYRNNVAVSLREALETGFPVLRKLIGPENFGNLAGIFLRKHPPSTPLLMQYGAEMPAFLQAFEPLAHVGYLPDVARLELALRHSYHAADAAPVAPEHLAALTEDHRISVAPSAVHLPSVWPIWDIWRFNVEENAPKPRAVAQHVLILRSEFDPVPHALTPAEGAWINALANGAPVGRALEEAIATDTDFDMTPVLTLLIQNNAITHTELSQDPPEGSLK